MLKVQTVRTYLNEQSVSGYSLVRLGQQICQTQSLTLSLASHLLRRQHKCAFCHQFFSLHFHLYEPVEGRLGLSGDPDGFVGALHVADEGGVSVNDSLVGELPKENIHEVKYCVHRLQSKLPAVLGDFNRIVRATKMSVLGQRIDTGLC